MKNKRPFANAITAVFASFMTIVIGLISKKIFIDILGAEYLGLNGLFSNIIAALAITELGFSTAIIYNMYKPMAKSDHEAIKSLMRFYRNVYRVIALAVFLIGMALIPFLPAIVGEVTIPINVNLVYILFILDTTATYILSYKRSILYVDQKNSIISLVHIAYLVLTTALQLTILIITKNYYLYLIVKIIMNIVENLAIVIIANKRYPYITERNVKKLDKNVRQDIFKKIRAIFFHKIGSYIVMGTDNIIISRYLGLVTVGLYSNYSLVISSLNSLIGQGISALTPTVGHILVTEPKEKIFNTFKKIRFVNFWLATISGCGIFVVMQSFITLWVGEEYLLSTITLAILTFIYFQNLMRYTYSAFKDSAGIFYEDRFVPIIESTINIVFSVMLVKAIGLPGVFIGTIISSLALWCYSYPKFVYKKLFERSYLQYTKETLGYIVLFVGITTVTYCAASFIPVGNVFLRVVLQAILSLVLSNAILIIVFRKSPYYKTMKKTLLRFTTKGTNFLKYQIASIKYATIKRDLEKVHIMSDSETIDKINQGYSIARYGDGEFNILLDNPTPAFQPYSKKLSIRLVNGLRCSDDKLLLCIQKGIQDFSALNRGARHFYMNFANKNWRKIRPYMRSDYTYGNANLSRFYIDYGIKKGSEERLAKLKTIWNNKDIVIVEGDKTFFGVNNDLLDNCRSKKRIICPSIDAFSKYDEILSAIKAKVKQEQLILLALGPTATILAIDLSKAGYHAVDIGHLDIEYEWLLNKSQSKDPIPGKAVNEAKEKQLLDVKAFDTTQYNKDIIAKIV